MNFSRYLCLGSTWLFSQARRDIRVNKCWLYSPGYALLWRLDDFLAARTAHSQVNLNPFSATEKTPARNYQK